MSLSRPPARKLQMALSRGFSINLEQCSCRWHCAVARPHSVRVRASLSRRRRTLTEKRRQAQCTNKSYTLYSVSGGCTLARVRAALGRH